MPDHAIEIEWLRSTRVAHDTRDFRDSLDRMGQRHQHVGGIRHGGTFRHVDDDGKFRFIVEWQHLHRNGLCVKRQAQRCCGADDGEQE